MIRLLLVEDDRSLGQTLIERLRRERYDAVWVETLQDGRARLEREAFDLVLLDLGLPDGSGFELAREIKRKFNVPIMFMTAQNSAENRLEGYELGAEEFIPKPFHLKEVLLRIRHVLDDHRAVEAIQLNDSTLDLREGSVTFSGGEKSFFTTRDADLLRLLIRFRHRVVSRDEILDALVGEDQFPSQRTVDNAIVRLRQVLRDGDNNYIRSVRGVGYQWTGSASDASGKDS